MNNTSCCDLNNEERLREVMAKIGLERVDIQEGCYDLSLELRLYLDKDLRIEKGGLQLVKCKDTDVLLHYIYKFNMR